MEKIKDLNSKLKEESDKRFDNFKIEEGVNLDKIQDEAYIRNSTWIKETDVVCITIDLNKSSTHSARRKSKTMAQLYEYFTQNIVTIMNNDDIKASYIDIKGDGAFGIYQGEKALEKAFIAGVTFKTFFEEVIKPKFKNELRINLNCKIGLDIGNVLVKKIGIQKYNNEVWAGRLVNNTHKIMGKAEKIIKNETNDINKDRSYIIISEIVYDTLKNNYEDYAIKSCGCIDGIPAGLAKQNLWLKMDVSKENNIIGDCVYYNQSLWCKNHGDEYIKEILK